MDKVTVRIENTYSDGHSSTHEVTLPAPDGDVEEWFEDEVFDHTGDGHGATNPKLGSLYEATIISGPAELIGRKYEWGG